VAAADVEEVAVVEDIDIQNSKKPNNKGLQVLVYTQLYYIKH
jgi:hypothetical protein